jgi:aminoglycoside 6'-N-acetyltransferase
MHGEQVELRPMEPADAERLIEIRATPEVARWWPDRDDGFPLSDPDDSTRLAILLEGELVGLIQYAEENDPDYRHAGVDIFVDPAHHGRGLGTDALRTLCRHLIDERGHHRITIDPAAENTIAIRAYEKVGFERVGVMRQYERTADGWRDGLLMELIAP